jgi:hypothetical protein
VGRGAWARCALRRQPRAVCRAARLARRALRMSSPGT